LTTIDCAKSLVLGRRASPHFSGMREICGTDS
jgi:hypothetical protein